jgi:hypothetical protein
VLTVEEVREHARQAVALDPDGPPSVRAEDVLPHLDSEDRNVRVAALRVLAWSDDPAAADGILRGLDDPKKRVREVAAKSSIRHLGDPRVVARLVRAIEEDDLGSTRAAIEILGGQYHGPYGLANVEPVASALKTLAALPNHRQQVLSSLLRIKDLTDDVAEILRDFVRDGTKEEAVAATRRLCGYRVERFEVIPEDVLRTAERAWGRVWFWIPA